MEQIGRVGRKPRALVVGAGVAGLAAASSLYAAGWAVQVCERAPSRRTGGYFVRLAAEGVAAADRLGAAGTLASRLPTDGVVRGVDRHGRTVSCVDASLGEEPGGLALVRGDLEQALWEALPDDVTVRFATTPVGVASDRDGVDVDLVGEGPTRAPADDPGPASTERYDLVVGADGVRSTVRTLVFGPEERFRRDFDHVVISAVLPRLPGDLAEGDYVVIAEPGRTAHLMAMAGHDPVIFFAFRADRPEVLAGPDPADDPVGALRAVYGDFGGLLPEILDGVTEVGTTHADTVGQIHLEHWSHGRVVLVGDAAWCPTLYSGQGSALALAGGERLGAALTDHPGDVLAGLAAWERELRGPASAASSQARRSRHFFLPGNRTVAALRSGALRMASWRSVGAVLRAVSMLVATGGRWRPGSGGGGGGGGADRTPEGTATTRPTGPVAAVADPPALRAVHPTATRTPGSWGPAALDQP